MTDRMQVLHNWLQNNQEMGDYELAPASEDASFRRYYRIVTATESFIIMDAPPDKEDCHSFLDISERLRRAGVNVPGVFAKDLENGFLLLGDLGVELYLDRLHEDNADGLYKDAIRALVRMQKHTSVERLPVYNESLLMQEMQLFHDWLLERHLQISLSARERRQLEELFHLLVDSANAQPKVFVHRDFHSRNLILHKENPGVIDYQDAVLGPVTYDLVSLLKDCYIKWPPAKVDQWLQFYHEQSIEVPNSTMDPLKFRRSFDLMGVQRHLKASGIFARLCHRDGKDEYLQDIPRTLSYIVDLADLYPELQKLIELLQNQVLPGLKCP